MSAFDDCRNIEAQGWEDLKEFLKKYAHDGRFVVTDKGNLSKFLQEIVGDGLFNSEDGKVWAFEFKTEIENKHGNLFLEYWSNLSRFNLGWIHKLQTDILFYHFQRESELYCVSFNKLLKWAFKTKSHKTGFPGRIYDWPLKCQKKYNQLNDTWGRCVPISVIENEIGLKKFNLDGKDCFDYQPKEQAQLDIFSCAPAT